jgi:hypothetical protein
MKFEQIEIHEVYLYKTMELEDEAVIEKFGTKERFNEILSHLNEMPDAEPFGEEPSDEEEESFYELANEADVDDSREDWVTDRDGGYSTIFRPSEED